jgi:hypothetical protein
MSTLTCVYCAVRMPERPSLRGVPAGIPGGAPVRALEAGGGVWLIVSSVAARDYGEDAIAAGLSSLDWVSRRALAHEAVVEHFLDADALLPLPLFTIFTSDARALATVCRPRARLDRLLDRVAGRLEWTVRVTLSPGVVESSVPGTVASRSGAAYLARKRDAWRGAADRRRAGERAAGRLYRRLAVEASDARRQPVAAEPANTPLVLDAVFLVPTTTGRAFLALVRREARALAADGLVVTGSGPWPPYHFVGSRTRRPAPRPAARPAPPEVRRARKADGR